MDIPYVRGQVARQAHVALPEGTVEEEYARNGFFGRYAHLYRRNAPVGWSRLEGPLRPRAYDTRKLRLPTGPDWLAARLPLLGNHDVQLHLAGLDAPTPYLFRNADADELLFVHQGAGRLETDFGSVACGPGDYLLLPRGVAYRLVPSSPTRSLVLEAFSEVTLQDKGMLGQHALDALFKAFGFSKRMRHKSLPEDLYRQGDITFRVNRSPDGFAARFGTLHGPSSCSMGLRVSDAQAALSAATARGAAAASGDHTRDGQPLSAVRGIGDSLVYLVEGFARADHWARLGFIPLESQKVEARGFTVIDHLTHNVEKGPLGRWASFYKDVFGFTEVRCFDIRGAKTGLTSYALRSPCGSFCIPINEADEAKSQINEYLRAYNGPGIQHIAFLTEDLLGSLKLLEGSPIQMLDMDADCYREAFQRVPNVVEDKADIQRRNVLVDGDAEGYLLQVFTRNLVGPIFIELIQRRHHQSFGEGNFGALLRSIERDPARRGVFDAP